MPKGQHLTKQIRTQLHHLYLEGVNLKKLSAHTGIPHETLAALKQREGWKAEREARHQQLMQDLPTTGHYQQQPNYNTGGDDGTLEP